MIYIAIVYILKEETDHASSKMGNSLAIRLPVAVVKALQLREGDEIEVLIAEDRVFKVRKKPENETILKRLRKFRGKLPADFKFDRDDANARA